MTPCGWGNPLGEMMLEGNLGWRVTRFVGQESAAKADSVQTCVLLFNITGSA